MSPSAPGHTLRDSLRADFRFKASVSGLQLPIQSFQQIAIVSCNLVWICRFGVGNTVLRLRRDCRERDGDPGVKISRNQVGLFYEATLTPLPPLYSAAGSQPSWSRWNGRMLLVAYQPAVTPTLYPDVAAALHCFQMTRESVTVSSVSEAPGS